MKKSFIFLFTALVFIFSAAIVAGAAPIKYKVKPIPNTNSNTINFGQIPLRVGLTDKGSPFYFKDKSTNSSISNRIWIVCYEGYTGKMDKSPVYMYDYQAKKFKEIGTYSSVFTDPLSKDLQEKIKNNIGNSDQISFDPPKEYKMGCSHFSFIVGLQSFDKSGKRLSGKVIKFQTSTNPFYNKDKTLKPKNIKSWEHVQLKFKKDFNI